MSNEDFVEEFIEKCIVKGITSQKDICNSALSEIQEIDEKLKESNQLRIRKNNLKNVLRDLGHESLKKARTNEEVKVLSEIDKIENSSYVYLMIQICNFVHNNVNSSITSREIINAISSMDNEKEVYICIKNLYDNGILARSSKDRTVIRGPKWEERPQLPINKSA